MARKLLSRKNLTLICSQARTYPLALCLAILEIANRALLCLISIKIVHDFCLAYTTKAIAQRCTLLALVAFTAIIGHEIGYQLGKLTQIGIESRFIVGSLFDILHQAMQTDIPFYAYVPTKACGLATKRFNGAFLDSVNKIEAYNYLETENRDDSALIYFGEPFGHELWRFGFFERNDSNRLIYITNRVVHALVFLQPFNEQEGKVLWHEYQNLQKEYLPAIEKEIGYYYGNSMDAYYGNGVLCQKRIFEELSHRYGFKYFYFPYTTRERVYDAVECALSHATLLETDSALSNKTAQV